MSFAITSLNFSNAKNVLQEGLQAIARGEHECDLENLAQVDSASIAVLLATRRIAKPFASSLHKHTGKSCQSGISIWCKRLVGIILKNFR